MKERVTITIEKSVLDREFSRRNKEVKRLRKDISRSQHIEDMIVEYMDSEDRKKTSKE